MRGRWIIAAVIVAAITGGITVIARSADPGASYFGNHARTTALGIRSRRLSPRRLQLGVESRLPSRRTAPLADHQGHHVRRHSHRCGRDREARRSGALQLSDRLDVGAGLLEPHRSRSGVVPRVSAQGRLRDLRGLRRRRAVERVRIADAPRAAGRHGSSSSRSRTRSSTRSSASRTSTRSCIRCTG